MLAIVFLLEVGWFDLVCCLLVVFELLFWVLWLLV